jgi:hypothetical protein
MIFWDKTPNFSAVRHQKFSKMLPPLSEWKWASWRKHFSQCGLHPLRCWWRHHSFRYAVVCQSAKLYYLRTQENATSVNITIRNLKLLKRGWMTDVHVLVRFEFKSCRLISILNYQNNSITPGSNKCLVLSPSLVVHRHSLELKKKHQWDQQVFVRVRRKLQLTFFVSNLSHSTKTRSFLKLLSSVFPNDWVIFELRNSVCISYINLRPILVSLPSKALTYRLRPMWTAEIVGPKQAGGMHDHLLCFLCCVGNSPSGGLIHSQTESYVVCACVCYSMLSCATLHFYI